MVSSYNVVVVVVVVVVVTMGWLWLPVAAWLRSDKGGGEQVRDGSCFPTADSGRNTYTCTGDNITSVPSNMPRNITQLNLSNTRVASLPAETFKFYVSLLELYIRNSTELAVIERDAFKGLQQLRILMIIDCIKLSSIGQGVLQTFQNLHTLRIVKTGLAAVPDFSVFQTKSPSHNGSMYEIDLTSNKIRRINQWAFRGVRTWLLRLENNALEEIRDLAFDGSQIFNLDFQNNPGLHSLGEHAFSGVSDLHSLNLSRTSIRRLPTDGLINIKELNVEDVASLKQFPSVLKFSHIDVARLTYPHHCCAFQHPDKQDPGHFMDYSHRQRQLQHHQQQLTGPCGTSSSSSLSSVPSRDVNRVLPSTGVYTMPGQTLWADQTGTRRDGGSRTPRDIATSNPLRTTHASSTWLPAPYAAVSGHGDVRDLSFTHDPSVSSPGPDGVGGFGHFGAHHPLSTTLAPGPPHPGGQGSAGGFGHFDSSHGLRVYPGNHNHKDNDIIWQDRPANEPHVVHSCAEFTRRKDYTKVVCTPVPNAFNPCEDVMGYEWLRVTVWFVLLATLCGNLVVIVVLVTARSKMTVPKFLMCNLSIADLLMGLYLLLLASIDVHSLGEYFTLAVSWQNDGGCQVAGFLTVFSSELSVFVLMVITLERWYAISYAIHITKRLRIRQAWALMLTGWLYASTMALLPLLGVSSYGAVSMCLPMEARDVWDRLYIVALLVLNGLAFLVICCCYISMFMKVRSSDTMARSNDATIAKRMSILVLTNFVCWAPIAFFGLTASFGLPMIDISNSKILLVFFYPFNSCANPFLYVILTKQFRKDVFILLGRYGICTQRANEYKGTYTYKSHSHSRHNGAVVHGGAHRLSDMSNLSRLSTKSSRGSPGRNGAATPRHTPVDTPIGTPHSSPRSSPLRRLIGVATSALMSHTSGSGWSAVAVSDGAGKAGGKERKLSVVPETSLNSDEGSGSHEERVLVARDSLRDLFDGKPHGRVRSASEYVVLYQSKDKGEAQARDAGRRRSSRLMLDRQPSLDTDISSNTDTSYISDSSWARLDSFGSGHSQTASQDSDWPGTARAAAVASAKRAASDSCGSNTPPLSPTIARMRLRFLPSRPRVPSDGESPTRPLPHAQLTRLLYNRSMSQESSGTDDDLVDEETKVRQSLL